MCRRGAALALSLAVLLTAQVALAARLAVSALEGDPKGKLRAQVTAALRKTRKAQVLPPTAWTQAAAKQGLTGPAAVGPSALKLLAPRLKVDAVLTGSVGATFNARLLDREGREVWVGSYPLKRGALAPKDLAALAQAVATSRLQPLAAPAPDIKRPPVSEVPPPAPPAPPASPEMKPSPAPQASAPKETPPRAPEAPASRPVLTPAEPAPVAAAVPAGPAAPVAWVELDAESHTYGVDPSGSGGGFPETPAVDARRLPPRVRLLVGATATWRKYCARPGVASCAEYDARPEEQRQGDTSDFTSTAPYLGFAAEAEVFPLAHRPSLIRGLGLTLAFQRGFAPTTVRVSSPTGSTPTREVAATDTAFGATLAYRVFFDLGSEQTPLWGHVGVRLGAYDHGFAVEDPLDVPVPVVHRLTPVVALEASVPLMRLIRLEGGGRLFYQPVPGGAFAGLGKGPFLSEVRDYGTAVSSVGWEAQLGLAGDLWGPFGYSARLKLEHYSDTFTGAGTRRGWTEGGVARDAYSSLWVGLTAAW
ncbi:hypothetical protein [Archangium primigenium]|uniref:hypothetical protein n=1 Tax=[Archangium] primigenium TaxID=2792470 RepID=UPI00195B39BB|nr:hypothetical protein [Archangium primigenium]